MKEKEAIWETLEEPLSKQGIIYKERQSLGPKKEKAWPANQVPFPGSKPSNRYTSTHSSLLLGKKRENHNSPCIAMVKLLRLAVISSFFGRFFQVNATNSNDRPSSISGPKYICGSHTAHGCLLTDWWTLTKEGCRNKIYKNENRHSKNIKLIKTANGDQ